MGKRKLRDRRLLMYYLRFALLGTVICFCLSVISGICGSLKYTNLFEQISIVVVSGILSGLCAGFTVFDEVEFNSCSVENENEKAIKNLEVSEE